MIIKNKTEKILFFSFLVLIFNFWVPVLAQNEITENQIDLTQKAIILPTSPFYFLKTLQEKIQLFFSFGSVSKAKQFLHLAEKRLAEYQRIQAKDLSLKGQKKSRIAEQTLKKYQEQLNQAIQKVEEAKNKNQEADQIANQISQTIQKHLLILNQIYQKVPRPAQESIIQAIQNSQKGFERVKELFSGEKREEIQKKTEKIKEKIDQKARRGIKKLWPIIEK